MGRIYFAKCENCDYEYEDYIGWAAGLDDRAKHLLKKMQRGNYGQEIKKIVAESPDCFATVSYELFVCQKCGNIERNDLIKIYDKEGAAEPKYVVEKYRCNKCKGKMQFVKIDDDFICPICKNKIKFNPCGWWD